MRLVPRSKSTEPPNLISRFVSCCAHRCLPPITALVRTRTLVTVAALSVVFACGVGDVSGVAVDAANGPDSGREAPDTPLDKAIAQARYVTTTDLMRHLIAPTCAAEGNECHNDEDFPDLHSEGNLWNLVGLGCNLNVGERDTIEDYCEAVGDQIRITDGANSGFSATIGSIELVTDDMGDFSHYAITVDSAGSAAAQTGGNFEFMRNGVVSQALGGGGSVDVISGQVILKVTDADHIPDPLLIRQGDENLNGTYGTGEGVIVKPGDARGSYMVRRLLEAETNRIRMPLGGMIDNPNELNPFLSANEMYALMSWINCMQEGDGVASEIRYDCAQNADNQGTW